MDKRPIPPEDKVKSPENPSQLSIKPVEDRDKEWLQARYHEALSDIRWTKERSSNITQWAVILLGALIASPSVAPNVSPCVLSVFGGLVTSISIGWVADLHLFAQRTRNQFDQMMESTPYPIKRGKDGHHVKYLFVHISVITVTYILNLIAIHS